jgi:hypothetical protein
VDVDGRAVRLNSPGKITLLMYTNPDLEDETRTIVKALDPFRTKSDFGFVRVVDLSGGVPLEVRTIVRMQIREQQDKENVRLAPLYKEVGITSLNRSMSPIVPDFSGDVIKSLRLEPGASHVQAIIFDRSGHEIKRFDDVSDSSTLPAALSSLIQ